MNYWNVVEPYWDCVSIDDPDSFLRDFSTIPAAASHLLASHWFVSEVSNGGLHQFFTNRTGVLAPEAVDGLSSIGLDSLATILAEAMAFFDSPYPRSRSARCAALDDYASHFPEGAKREEWDPFFPFDDRFYATIFDDGHDDAFSAAADRYAQAVFSSPDSGC